MTPVPLSETNAEFWLADERDSHLRGWWSVEEGSRGVALLDGELADAGTVAVFGDPDEQVRSFAPRDVFGILDSGEKISLLGANNFGDSGQIVHPRFESQRFVVGAHLMSSQKYSTIRIRLDRPEWTVHLSDGDESVCGDGAVLRVEASDAGNWLVYESRGPNRLGPLTRMLIEGTSSLTYLALNERLVVTSTEIRIDRDSPFLQVFGSQYSRDPQADKCNAMLSPGLLTVDRFAEWLVLHDKLDNLDGALKELDGGGPVQVRALLGTTLIEGFHRRLGFPQSRFPSSTPGGRSKVRSAARDAALEESSRHNGFDTQQVGEAVASSLARFADVSFKQRAADIIAEVVDVVPEMVGAVPQTSTVFTKARNDLAHHLRGREDYSDDAFLSWTVVAHCLPWILRAFLLTRIGLDAEAVRTGIIKCMRYQFACANVREFVRQLDGGSS